MRIISPVDHLAETAGLLEAGADELYGGYVPPEWQVRFDLLASLNPRTLAAAQINSAAELQGIVRLTHAVGRRFILTLNAPFYSDAQLPLLLDYLDRVVAMGIDGLILADLGLLRLLAGRYPALELHASTLAHISNSGALRFYASQGIRRAVLPRHLPVVEMADIAAAVPDVRCDAFLLVGKCPNTEGLCTFQHVSPERIWPCEIPYRPVSPFQPKPISLAKSAAAAGRAAAAAGAAGAAAAASAAAASAASASRFADRFAPPKPAARTIADHSLEILKPAAKADPKLANAWKHKGGRELTEAELLAMPDAEYMNEKQLDFFRARLGALKDDLLSNAGETTEHLREDTSIVPDPADRATIEEEHALELRTRDRERKLLKKISQSLARIEAGDYGYCDETGEPIGLGRLLARPTATLSLEAQQRREMKQKMFGD